MRNEEVARLLREMGDLLELRGESSFTVVRSPEAGQGCGVDEGVTSEILRQGCEGDQAGSHRYA